MNTATRSGKLSRRTLLEVGGAAGLSLLAASACDLSTEPEDNNTTGNDTNGAKEAPALAKLAKSGDLPPLADRLPTDPLVVEPTESVGTYGGTWQSAVQGTANFGWLDRTVCYEALLRWSPDGWEPIPNVASSWDASEDGREFTFHLRAGMKWSDGKPFTADDIVFAYNDVALNAELFPVPPEYFVRGGEPAVLEKLDDVTVKFTFAEPNALFAHHLAYHPFAGRLLCNKPRHYLEEFHADYNDAVADLAADEGYANWVELFLAKGAEAYLNQEVPTICAWMFTSELGGGARVACERNPYYWKTDPDGKQLPYIDEVVFDVVDDAEVMLLKATNGELAIETFTINTLENKPVLAEHREESGYDFIDLVDAVMNYGVIALNFTHEDAGLADIFRNKDFRIGLSHAINREEIINAVFQRQGEPWQAAPRKESDFYNETLAKQYTEFDVDLANEHLDRAGLDQKDADGWRLRPDGERLTFMVDLANPSPYPAMVGIMELVEQYWKDVGVNVRVNTIDRSLFLERRNGNQHQANIWPGGAGLSDALLDPYWYLPFQSGSSYAVPWATWFASSGADGEEPPAPAQRQIELYRQITETLDSDEQIELLKEILAIAQEEFYAIGTVAPTQGYGIVSNSLHNVPDEIIAAATFYTPGPTNPEQYFLSSG